MVKFGHLLLISVLALSTGGISGDAAASDNSALATPLALRGSDGGRSLQQSGYICDLCAGNNQFPSPQNAQQTVTLPGYGTQNCAGLHASALAGGVIPNQSTCQALRTDFAPCCNSGVDLDPQFTTVPGPAPDTDSPVASPTDSPMSILLGCAAATNNTDGPCGEGDRGNGVCEDGSCCSQYGWCGNSDEHCSSDPLRDTAPPATTPPSIITTVNVDVNAGTGNEVVGTCGGGLVGNGICANGACCSKFGYCGNTESHCLGQ